MKNLKIQSEEALLQQYISRQDYDCLGEVLRRYSILLLGVALKYVRDEDLAQDLVQQVFEKAINETGRYDISNYGGWLYRIMVNQCLSYLRKKKSTVSEELPEYLRSEEMDVDLLIRQDKRYDLLEEALGALRPEQRQCVELFYLKQYSYQQIAAETGMTLNEVKSYIQNGKRKLKIIIEKKENS